MATVGYLSRLSGGSNCACMAGSIVNYVEAVFLCMLLGDIVSA
jgi:hypothetical protein